MVHRSLQNLNKPLFRPTTLPGYTHSLSTWTQEKGKADHQTLLGLFIF
jgi:hypothetical protein